MKYTNPRPEFRSSRTFVANLLAFVLLASQLAPLASAQGARGGASGRQPDKAKTAQPGKGDGGGGVKIGPAQIQGSPAITATKVDAFPDPDMNGRVDPGATITYTVTITNNGDVATGVVFNDTPDANTSLVAGSVNTSPIVGNDTYNVIGNVRIQPNTAQGLLANDRDPDTGNSTGLTVTALAGDNSAPFSGTSAQGGQVASSTTDGAFSYNPAPGFAGQDTFSYTVSDAGPDDIAGNADDTTDTATVTLQVGNGTATPGTNVIWFIDDTAPAGGDGRLTSPFNCYTGTTVPVSGPTCFSSTAADEAGDAIFLFDGAYVGGNTLLNTQKLIGQGAGATLATIAAVTVEPYSDPLPTTGGASNVDTVSITTALAATNAVPLAQGNLLRGFKVGATTGAKIFGNNFGTLTAGDSTALDLKLEGAGQALNLTTGSFAATSGFASVATTSATSAAGITLTAVGGTVSFGPTTVSGAGTQGINIAGSAVNATFGTTAVGATTQGILIGTSTGAIGFGATTVTSGTDAISLQNNSAGTRTFGSITTSGNSGAGFLHGAGGGTTTVTGATSITNPTGIGISIQNSNADLSFAGTTVNKNSTGNNGLLLQNNASRTITFSSLAVTTSNGTGLQANDSGTVNVTNAAGSFINSTGTGHALNTSNVAFNANFTTITSTNAGSGGILLGSGTTGALVVNNGAGISTSITNPTGVGINHPSAINATFGNTVVSGSSSTGVISSGGAGSITFGDLDITPDSGAGAFEAVNKSAGTITTTSGDLTATGAPTLNINGLSAANRTALAMVLNNLDSTNSSGVGVNLTFVSGTFTVNDGTLATSITNPTGIGLQVVNSAATFSFGNTVVNQSGGTGVVLGTAANGNSGTITFADLDIAPDSGQRALNAQQNTGAITVTSGTITTTNATAVEVAGPTSASRTPLNVQLTTVNTTGGSVAANGIALTNTSASGSPGGFRVLGTGGTCTELSTAGCTGGRITATAGAEDGSPEDNGGVGVRLSNANQVFLTRMRIDNHPNFAVFGANVVGFNLDASVLDGTNGTNAAFDEGVIALRELTGTTGAGTASSVTNSFMGGGHEFILDVRNFTASSTLDRLTVTGNTFGTLHTTGGDDAAHLEALGSGQTFRVTFSSNVVRHGRGDIVNYNVGNGGTMTADLVMRNNTLHNTHPQILSGGGGVTITAGGATNHSVTYDISCNSIRGSKGFGLLVTKAGTGASGTMQGTIFNNRIGVQGTAGSASSEASGLNMDTRGGGTHTALIKNNQVHGWGANGAIQIFNNQGNATANVTLQGNLTTGPHPVNSLAGLYAETGALAGDTSITNLLVGGSGANENNFVDGDPFNGNDVLLSRIAGGGTTFNLSRGVSGASNVQQIITDNNVDPVTAAGAGTITFVNTSPALPPVVDQTCTPPSGPISIGEADTLADSGMETPNTSAGGETNTPPAQPQQFILPVVAQPQPVAQAGGQMNVASAPQPVAASVKPEKATARKAEDSEASVNKAEKPAARAIVPLGAPGNVSVNIGTLNPGDSVTITFQVTVDNPFPAGVTQVSNQGTVSGTNFSNVLTDDPAAGGPADPTVTLVQAPPDINVRDASTNEPATGSKDMPFTVTLSAPPLNTVSVNFTTADEPAGPGKAVAGVDYTATNGTVTFLAGQTVQTISVPVLADADAEPDETFLVNLSTPVNGNIVDGQAVGTITTANPAGTTLISELRTSGPGTTGTGDPNDEFVEIYNNTDTNLTISTSDGSPGWGLFKMGAACTDTPVLIGTIPNGTIIPGRGHYLFVGTGYSLAAYAAGNLTLTAGIEDDRNVGLFSTTNTANLATGTRKDAVGFGLNTGINCNLLREGSTLNAAQGSISQHTFVRNQTTGVPLDRNDNAGDFFVLSTTPATGVGTTTNPMLGAPGPENLASPINRSSSIKASLADPLGSPTGPQNRVRDFTSDPANNSTSGTLAIRRKFTNTTGGSVTRLRFRIIDITTCTISPCTPGASAPAGVADLRVRTSTTSTINLTGGGTAQVQGLTLETPPAQPNGGGWNSTVAAGTITAGTPLAAGASINVEFLLGLQQTGTFRFFIIVEALPGGPPFGPEKLRSVGADDNKDVPQN